MAWIIGVVCVGAVAALVLLALPILPFSVDLFRQGNDTASQSPDTDAVTDGSCREMYVEPLWATLEWTPGSSLEVSTEAPDSAAPEVVTALDLVVDVRCDWTSDRGTIATTRASVASDAGDILRSALPPLGFVCTDITEGAPRVRCVLVGKNDAGETIRIETIEAGEGTWVSSVQEGWWPEQYATRVGNQVWNG